jgi:hypothetical protein
MDQTGIKYMRFQVIMASMKMTVFWEVAGLTQMMEAISSSEMSDTIYQTTWCNFQNFRIKDMENDDNV